MNNKNMIKTISSENWKAETYNYPAGFLIRLIAYVIDFLVFVVPIALLFFAIEYFFKITLPENLIEILFLIYIILYHWKDGATIGKKLAEVRVENENGERIKLSQSIIRSIFPIISLIITILFSLYQTTQTSTIQINSIEFEYTILEPLIKAQFYLNLFIFGIIIIDVFWMFTNKENQTLHDLIAKTKCKKK